MNILFISEQMDTGGSQKEILGLCKELQKLGHNLSIASNGGSLVASIRNAGLQHYGLPYRSGLRGYLPLALLSLPYCLFRTIKIVKSKRIDIVHAYTYLIPMAIASLACRIIRVPLVITLNDGIFDHPAKLSIIKSSNILKKAEKVIIISAEMRDLIRDLGHYANDQDKIVVIPNMVDLEEMDVSKDGTVVEEDVSAKHSSRILWASRLSPDKIKAIVNVVESATAIIKRVPGARISIVGQGSRYNQVLRLAEEVNRSIGDRAVIVTGFVKDISSMMRSSDVIVGMGKVVIEAMAFAKPVVVVGHITGRFGGNFGGVVTKENVATHQAYNYSGRESRLISTPDRISEACITLLTDREYSKMLGKFGREHVEQVHDSRKIGKQLERVYTDVFRGAHPNGDPWSPRSL